MNKRSITGFLLGVVMLFWAFYAAWSSCVLRCYTLSFPVMGTVAKVTLYATETQAQHGFSAVKEAFSAVAQCADWRKPECELFLLNQAAGEGTSFRCSPMLGEMLREAELACKISDGAFDITVKPLMELWGFYRKRSQAPGKAEIQAALQRIGMNKLRLDLPKITFLKSGMGIDLGGIAKGYALDRAAAACEKLGITRGVIDLGGNLRLLSQPPPGQRFYRIGIREPVSNSQSVVRALEVPPGCGVSTSGDYERFVVLKGQRYGHIIDPATGIPQPGRFSATVIASSAMRADWISTALYLRGEKLAAKLRKTIPEIQIFLVPIPNK